MEVTASPQYAAEARSTPMSEITWYEDRQSFWRRFFGVVQEPRTYRSLLYALVSFPLGLAWFVLLVTGISVGLGMAITLVGIPILVFMLFAWGWMAEVERAVANALLGTSIPPLAYNTGERAALSSRIKARLVSSMTWRTLFFLLLRFPHGIAMFTLATLVLSLPVRAVIAPFLVEFTGATFGPGEFVDTWQGAALLAIPTLLLVFPGLHLLNGVAWVSGKATEALIGGQPVAHPAAADRTTRPFPGTERPEPAAAPMPAQEAAVEVGDSAGEDEPPEAPAPIGDNATENPASAEIGGDDQATLPRIEVDVASRLVRIDGQPLDVTRREFDLLALFTANPDRAFTREELLDRIWKNELDITDRTIDTHVQRLRKKLGAAAERIQTVWGVGYRFSPRDDERR